ncbi:MAG: hypothetical protein H6626_15290 [Pseudobdellovibrionaceae bacterium]|nr:MAG: hypothetical protein H6626_15290 [Pseudobdellovibrionaceae bacterium]
MNIIPLPRRSGSRKNLLNIGPQLKYEELTGVSFINPSIGHNLVVKVQNQNLDKVEQWLSSYTDGIRFE